MWIDKQQNIQCIRAQIEACRILFQLVLVCDLTLLLALADLLAILYFIKKEFIVYKFYTNPVTDFKTLLFQPFFFSFPLGLQSSRVDCEKTALIKIHHG